MIGSSKTIELQLDVQNAGETAYETKLILYIPSPVQLYTLPSGCDNKIDESNVIVTCIIDNKFNAGSKVRIMKFCPNLQQTTRRRQKIKSYNPTTLENDLKRFILSHLLFKFDSKLKYTCYKF